MSNVMKPITPGNAPYATDVDQLRQVLSGTADVGTLTLASPITAPSAPSLAIGSAGVLNGAYKYKIVAISGWKENNGTMWVNGFAPGTAESTISPANQQVVVTIPAFAPPIIAYAVYRTAVGGATGTESYVGYVMNSGANFNDNVADAARGTGMPAWNGTAVPAAFPTINTTGTNLAQLTSHTTDDTQHTQYAVTTNVGNDYSITIPNCGSLVDGFPVCVKFNAASTGAITLNPNGLGAKSVVDYYGNAVTNVRLNLIGSLRYDSVSGNFIYLGKGGGGNATAAQLLLNATASTDAGPIVGTMPNNAGAESTTGQSATNSGTYVKIRPQPGWYDGSTSNYVQFSDSNYVTANIRGGVTLFGLAGKASVVETSSGTATAAQILSGIVAFVNGFSITGTMINNVGSAIVLTANNADQAIPQGYYGGSLSDGKVAAVNPSAGSTSYTTAGTYTWNVPAGVTRVLVGITGGGGGGGGSGTSGGYGGGGGGAFTSAWVAVPAGGTVTVVVGSGGSHGLGMSSGGPTAGTNGTASSFGSISANGGTGGTLGSSLGGGTSNGTGLPYFYSAAGGGAGGGYGQGAGGGGGGGAGKGGPGGTGGTGGASTPGAAGTAGPTGGAAIIPGGAGGAGGAGGQGGSTTTVGGNGNAPGGGGGSGGGGAGGFKNGGDGAPGAVYIQW